MIGFDNIPISIRTPGVYVEFDPSRAVKGAALLPHDVLLVGQRSGGSAVAGTIYEPDSDAEAVALFGAKSQLRQMFKTYRVGDTLTRVFCCASATDGGTPAAGSFVFTGPATESGELPLYVGGRRIAVPVVNGDTAATLETSALAAFAAYTDESGPSLPVTVAANAGTGVDLTAVQHGTMGNQIMLGVALRPGERIPAGVTVTTTAMASGATDPSFAGAITAMGEDQYNTIVSGNSGDTVLDLFEAELESRWGPMRQIEGQVFAALYASRANLTTAGNARNSFSSSLIGAELSALLPLPWELAAAVAARDAVQAQVDPARALTHLSLPGFSAAPRGTRFTRAERDILLSDGVSTVMAASDGRLLIERMVTTWQTNAASLPDTSYQDLTTVRLLAALRFATRARISSKFGRSKLVSDNTVIPAGQPMVNPRIIRSELLALFLDFMELGWTENFAQYKAELLVERDIDSGGTDPNRVNALTPPDLVNNLLVTAVKMSFKR